MLRRSEFKRSGPARLARDPNRERSMPVPTAAFRMPQPVGDQVAAIEKENALQHKAYMDLVRQLPCARCGKHGPSQFCHADMGKGMGIKTDCRRGFPGCPECHVLLGSSGRIPLEDRRGIERAYGDRTRAKIEADGAWPPNLPRWP